MVTIRKFSNPGDAQLAKTHLESAGILVFLKNENFSTMAPIYGTSITEIELQVEKGNIKDALEILGPEKGSSEEVERISKRLNIIFLFIAGMFFLGGSLHAFSHGFDTDRFDESAMVGFVSGLFGVLLVTIFGRKKVQPVAGTDATR